MASTKGGTNMLRSKLVLALTAALLLLSTIFGFAVLAPGLLSMSATAMGDPHEQMHAECMGEMNEVSHMRGMMRHMMEMEAMQPGMMDR
jgi:hypothetical protein